MSTSAKVTRTVPLPKRNRLIHYNTRFISASSYAWVNVITDPDDAVEQNKSKLIRWYVKSGCCESIRNIVSPNKRYYFYIPLWLTPFSIGKLTTYINDLNELGVPLQVMGVVSINAVPKDPEDPLTGTTTMRFERWGSEGLDTICWMRHDVTPTAKDDRRLLIVKVTERLTFGLQLLHIQQLIRATFMAAYSTGLGPSSARNAFYYYIPQMYFRLRHYFPRMSKNSALAYSHIITGGQISSTWHHLYTWVYPFRGTQHFSLNRLDRDYGLNYTYAITDLRQQNIDPTLILRAFNDVWTPAMRRELHGYYPSTSGFWAEPYFFISGFLKLLMRRPNKKHLASAIQVIKHVWHITKLKNKQTVIQYSKIGRSGTELAEIESAFKQAESRIAKAESSLRTLAESVDIVGLRNYRNV